MGMQAFDGKPVDDAIFLSVAAYNDPSVLGSNDIATYLKNNGWTELTYSDLPSLGLSFYKNGYYTNSNAEAIAAVKGDTVGIALRGTEDMPEQPQDFYSAAYAPLTYYNNELPFINAAISYANNNSSIHKIIITGHSLGGQATELFAADPQGKDENGNTLSNPTPFASKFQNSDINIISFASPGIPDNLTSGPQNRSSQVYSVYNVKDPIYNMFNTLTDPKELALQVARHGALAAYFTVMAESLSAHGVNESLAASSGIIPHYIHPGTPRALYPVGMDGKLVFTVSGTLEAPHVDKQFPEHDQHNYKAEIDALKNTYRADSLASSQTALLFGGDDNGLNSNVTIDTNSLGLNAQMYFLGGLGGNDSFVGSKTGINMFAPGPGNHTLTANGSENIFEFTSGNDTINNFNVNTDSLWLPTDTVYASYDGHDSILKYSGGSVTFKNLDWHAAPVQLPHTYWAPASNTTNSTSNSSSTTTANPTNPTTTNPNFVTLGGTQQPVAAAALSDSAQINSATILTKLD